MAETLEVIATSASFDELISGDKPVLVDFWAEWCAPCRAIAPALKEIAQTDDRLQIAKLNVDDEPDVARKLGVESIPTLILFRKGEEKARLVGSRGKEQLLREIEPHLA